MPVRLILLLSMSAASGPVMAQSPAAPAATQPAAQTQGQIAAPAPKPKMIKKTICRRVDDEETTGSRVGSAPKVCTTVEVPAPRERMGEPG